MSAQPLWNYFEVDGQQEPYLDNPPIWILNPKGQEKMKARRRRTASGRFTTTTGRKAAAPRRRRVARRRAAPTAMAANPRGRRRTRRAVSRRAFRRNPPPNIMGFSIKDILIGGATIIGAPFVEKQIMGILPASMAGTQAGRWAVKVGTAVALGYGAKKFVSPKIGNLVLLILGANLVADAVQEFAPQLTGGAGAYVAGMGAYTNRGLGGGPNPAVRGVFSGIDRNTLSPMTSMNDPLRSMM